MKRFKIMAGFVVEWFVVEDKVVERTQAMRINFGTSRRVDTAERRRAGAFPISQSNQWPGSYLRL